MPNPFENQQKRFGDAAQQPPTPHFEFNWTPIGGNQGQQQRPADVSPPINPLPTWRPAPSPTLTIPTLRSDVASNQFDTTQYKPTDEGAQVFNKVRDSVVRLRNVLGTNAKGEEQAEFGTGFFISNGGRIATAYHVVEDNGGKEIKVDLPDGRTLNAHVVDTKPLSDIAVLQIDGARPGETFKPVELADTAGGVSSGQSVYAVGHPDAWTSLYLSPGTVQGKVPYQDTALNVKDPTPNPMRQLVIANIHVDGGNSGSPLLNSEGKAVGIVSFGNGVSSGLADTVDDLHSLLGDAPAKSYYPSSLTFGPTAQRDAFDLGAAGVGLLAARSTKGIGRWGGALAMGANAWDGARDLTGYDLSAFSTAWDKGSTAEKFSTTLNLSADVGMVGSALFYALGGTKVRTAASLFMAGSTAAKMFNAAGSDRTY